MAQAAATFSAPKKKIKVSAGRRVFVVFNYIFCFLVGMICLVPVLHILAVSFSGIDAVVSNKVTLWPIDFNLENYEIVVRDAQFFRSYLVTFLRAIVGWAVSMLMTVLASYPMSLRQSAFPKRKYFVWYFMGTMLFNGGMIPTYLVVRYTGLLNTFWAMILPCAVGTYYIILMIHEGTAGGHFRIRLYRRRGPLDHTDPDHPAPVQALHCHGVAVHHSVALELLVRRHALHQGHEPETPADLPALHRHRGQRGGRDRHDAGGRGSQRHGGRR